MVTTKHCVYSECNSDSRYSDRAHMQGVFFMPFPKPRKIFNKCVTWVKACRRGKRFTIDDVTKDTYICSLHFIGGNGPTEINPNPVPATSTLVVKVCLYFIAYI